MICRDCKHSFVDNDKSGREMAKMGYRSCAAARNAVERAMYVKGDQKCLWPKRVK